jgi:hypothetical protein
MIDGSRSQQSLGENAHAAVRMTNQARVSSQVRVKSA